MTANQNLFQLTRKWIVGTYLLKSCTEKITTVIIQVDGRHLLK